MDSSAKDGELMKQDSLDSIDSQTRVESGPEPAHWSSKLAQEVLGFLLALPVKDAEWVLSSLFDQKPEYKLLVSQSEPLKEEFPAPSARWSACPMESDGDEIKSSTDALEGLICEAEAVLNTEFELPGSMPEDKSDSDDPRKVYYSSRDGEALIGALPRTEAEDELQALRPSSSGSKDRKRQRSSQKGFDPEEFSSVMPSVTSSKDEVSIAVRRVSTRSLDSDEDGEDMEVVPPSENSSQSGDHEMVNAKERSILQFSTSMYFCCPQYEDVMTLDVMRIGNTDCVSEVKVSTVDASAQAGVSFEATTTTLTFQPGDFQAEFKIPLLNTSRWGTTTEFTCVCQEEGLKGAELGRYLYHARVKVINKNAFPTNKYAAQEDSARATKNLEDHTISPLRHLLEYFRFNFQDPVVKAGSIKMVWVNFLHNMQFLLKALGNVYLLNFVLNTSRSSSDLYLVRSRSASLLGMMVIGFALIAPLHLAEYIAPTWLVPGRSRAILQLGFLTKYLNYEVSSRNQLPDGAMMLAATRDRRELVHKGYMRLLELLRSMGQIFMALLFQFLAPALFGAPMNADVFISLLCYPVVVLILLKLRWGTAYRALKRQDQAENLFAAHVESTQQNLRLIIDYARRPHFENMYKDRVEEYNRAATAMSQIVVNNKYFGKWINEFFLGMYVFQGGMKVINGDLTLGVYLTNVIMVQEIGDSWGNIYEILIEMAECIPNCERFLKFLNLPTDVERRMRLNRARRQWSTKARSEARKSATQVDLAVHALPLDTMPIVVNKISQAEYEIEGHMTVQQGELVAVVGPPGEGKSTILKMLGGVLLPVGAEPGFFVPSHLRCLHVCEEALFFRGTLFDNLTFGLAENHVDARMERVIKVLQGLKVPEVILEFLKSAEECQWSTVLSITQSHQLNLARALITNPELLIIQKPTMAFDEAASRNVLAVLQKYVRHRGVALEKRTRHLRRPRTCIMTSSKVFGVEISDQVFMVSKAHGIRKIRREDVAPIMLG